MSIPLMVRLKLNSVQDLIDKLQNQVRMFKKQLEEAEDIASNNLAKYKIIQKVRT